MGYTHILIDTLNLLYRIKHKVGEEPSILVSSKHIYKNLVAKFIEQINSLSEQHLESDGKIYLLFDNPTSRFDLNKSFYFAQRKQVSPQYKEQRAKESKEFYNSLDLIRYYYLTNAPKYICIQISNLEADDLVKPVIENYCTEDSRILMVTNDYDWTRYLASNSDWLPDLSGAPQTVQDFIDKKGFQPTEQSVIAYKSIFGDPSDNIAGVITETVTTLDEFKEIYGPNAYLAADTLIAMSHSTEKTNKFKILRAIKDNDRQFRINIQLTSTMPVNKKHLTAVTSVGRNSKIITESIETVLGLRENKREFIFGKIKSPK